MTCHPVRLIGRNSWNTRQGYQHTSRHSSRWERPPGQPGIIAGTALIASPFIIVALLIVAFS